MIFFVFIAVLIVNGMAGTSIYRFLMSPIGGTIPKEQVDEEVAIFFNTILGIIFGIIISYLLALLIPSCSDFF